MKFPDDYINKIIQGDCLEVMKGIPDKSVALILTDPPYGIDYQGSKRPNEADWDKIKNDEKEMDFSFLLKRPERKIIFGANNFLKQLPHKGRWICWDKRLTEKADNMLGSPFELAWCDDKTGYYKMYRVLHGGVVNADYMESKKRFHPTQKPVELIKKILMDFTKEGDIILDPFLGSGTTAVACKQLKRNYIGIEISPEYCKIAEDRLRQELLI